MARRKKNPETLREHLERLTIDGLRRLSRHIPESIPTRKAEIVDVIHRGILGENRLDLIWQQLDELQRAAVAEVVHSSSNQFDANMFRAKYGDGPNWGERSRSWSHIDEPSILGLLFYNQEMPTDVKETLQTIVPKPRAVAIETVSTLPEYVELSLPSWQARQREEAPQVELSVRDTQRMAHHDLIGILRLVEAGNVQITAKTQQPTASSVRSASEVLYLGDFYPPHEPEVQDEYSDITEPGPMRAFAWPLLLLSGKLAEKSGSKLQLTKAGVRALTAPTEKTLKTVWSRWLRNTLSDEFNRISTIKGQTGRGKNGMTAPSSRRKVIAEALSELPVNEWVSFDEFSRYMQARGHVFEVSHDLWELYVEEHEYGSLGYAGFGDWHIIQARYLLVFLMEYAATLGLIDIAYIPPSRARMDYFDLWGVDDYDALSNYDGLRYLRVNNLGAWILGLADSYQPPIFEESNVLAITPDFEITVIDKLAASDKLVLNRFAQAIDEKRWQLEQSTLLQAHEAGFALDEAKAFLVAKSGQALPQSVELMFTEIAENIKQLIKNEPAHLIEIRESETAHLLSIEKQLSKYCQLVGDRYLVVPAKSLAAFRRRLHVLGYVLPSEST